MHKLRTQWGKCLDKTKILPEYPRPHLVRESYFSLNGEWEYAINQSEHTEHYDGTILVPFSPEALLSGVERVVMPDDFLHYKKVFSLPEGFRKDRVLLHFGAVDQECTVCLNGHQVGTHKGGYLPFCFDISPFVRESDNVLTLCVIDKTEYAPHARGKQKLMKKGKYGSLFYTPNSGIWKTVWLESVSRHYVSDVRITPLFDQSAVEITVLSSAEGTAHLRILDCGQSVAQLDTPTNTSTRIPLKNFKPWFPKSPHLYDVEIEFEGDQVSAYFGMRKYSYQKDKNGILRFYLNNKPFFFNGLLDQGYWPDGLLTAPSDEALLYDIVKLKELGFNTIRKHIKIEAERFYYHCDRLGMVVWQDMPNGGGDYNMVFVTYLPNAFNWFARGVKDNLYSFLKRTDQEGRKQYYKDLEGMVQNLYNHPCIAVWVPFNEGWGQFDAQKATALIRRLDSTRLINEACGWFDQKGGDLYSIHSYVGKLKIEPQKDRVVALTEFGGYAYPIKGHTTSAKSFGYRHYGSIEELTKNYKKLVEKDVLLNVENGLSPAIYAQTRDVENHVYGFFTSDREVVKLQENVVKELNRALYRRFAQVAAEDL